MDKSSGLSEEPGSQNLGASPMIGLPKGGGAIRGIGEKFAANPVTGTGSMNIPIATSPGRSGFGPQLNLSYDSGSGNGPFGFGWSLSIPAITRKTDKGLPRYQDSDEPDVFLLSGAEDLVPMYKKDQSGNWEHDVQGRFVYDDQTKGDYQIRQYRPRIEGLFARIERWADTTTGETHWRSITKDNITTVYGEDNNSRIFDPADSNPQHPTHIFSWLICQSYDDKGNAIVYEYKAENSENINLTEVHERNRTELSRSADHYIKRIKYGNRTPNRDLTTWEATDPTQLLITDWMFEVVFDYGEDYYLEDAPDAEGRIFGHAESAEPLGSKWAMRQDPFSTYRPGFEVRAYRLCHRVMMFHNFPQELGIADCLVRSTEFTYVESPVASFITSVIQSGYLHQPDATHQNRYLKKSLPPVEFEYSQVPLPDQLSQLRVRDVDAGSLENLPIGLDGAAYQWMDLDGEGTSGILTEQADGWHYKRNLSANNQVIENGHERTVTHFGPDEVVARKPVSGLSAGAQFLDLAGDGQVDMVQMEGPVRGFYERTTDADWEPFQSFESWSNLNTRDPNLKFVDLTGDGHADILITEGEVLTWHPSLAEDGFGSAVRVSLPLDEEKGLRLVFADGTQSIYLADLSGDGLTDLVRIRNGETCYWPNLGYGHFGAKVTMDNAPWFDSYDQFDQRRIRLADTDGSGTTDILYLRRDGVQIYFNQSGNRWSDAVALPQFPPIDNISSVLTLDLLGNGTACLVWSSPLPGNTRQPMRYIALMEEKPHLMIGVKNNLGAETKVHYAPSTKFYLNDKREGKPWITRLPFPVHVVERTETYDWISRNRFVTRYAYHHGYFDGVEREFRGFGMVEQCDTEEIGSIISETIATDDTNWDAASYVPPVLTRTWFHTGAYIEGGRISRHFKDEYYHEGDESENIPGLTDQQLEAMLLPDTQLPTTLKKQDGSSIPWDLVAEEIQEACRALKGSVLRREIYALDGTDEQDRPYNATEQNYTVELLQPRGDNQHAVFFTHPRESINFHYERKLVEVAGKKLADPRVTHAITLEVDGYGNALKTIAIGYGRRQGLSPLLGSDKDKQEQVLITYAENEVTGPIDDADDYRTPVPCEARSYELLKIVPDSNLPDITNLFRFDEMVTKAGQAGDGSHELAYEDISAIGATDTHPYRRLIEHVRTLYRKNDLAGVLPLGQLESLAIPFESVKLAFTPRLLSGVYGAKVTGSMLADDGRYVPSEGDANWWVPSGKVFFDVNAEIANPLNTAPQELAEARAHFFLPRKFVDPFDQSATVDYDPHDLTMVKTQDALGNIVISQNDYRVLQPSLITDPNGNRAAASFDALGLVAGSSIMGKASETLGDSLAGFAADLTQAQIDDLFGATDLLVPAGVLLGNATTRIVYDVDRFKKTQTANPNDPTLWEPSYAATLARETHASDPLPPQGPKIQIGFSYSDGFGREIQKKIQAEPGPVVDGGPVINPRWAGSGWTIFNNKGKPVRQYEPFFDDTHAFKFGVTVGVSPVLFYDPVERVVATLHPNHTYEKVVFDPWQQTTYDVNDTVTSDPKTDEDVKEFFTRLPDANYLPTWFEQRSGGLLGSQEQDAAQKTAAHANTPTIAYFDTLGRPFLTIADNAADGKYSTRVGLDIEGNQREVVDANDRIVMQYDYSMLGTRIHQASMEAGERWMLTDVAGKPLYTWDSRDHQFRTSYDPLRRPTDSFLREGAAPEQLIGRAVFGESRPNPELKNQRGKVVQFFDQAGVVSSEDYDFKGNLRRSSRTVADEYKKIYDWNNDTVQPSWEIFTSSTTYDALNRPTSVTAPDDSVYRPTFNEANLLERVDVNLRGAQAATPFVTDIDYDAKGQRTLIEYGNNVKTEYTYDPLTFRLTNLKTTRLTDQARLQDLRYTYDPVGNITQIQDNAQQTIYFNNQTVTPSNAYNYDALYRLISAGGREHIGQVSQPETTWNDEFRVKLQNPQNGQAMRTYAEQYLYDAVGNFEKFIHQASNGNWTRSYAYNEPSLIEPINKKSNRLSSTAVGSNNPVTESYDYDAHGNMTAMPHLTLMQWDFRDQLQATSRQTVTNGTPETTWYVYDASGQRVRKVTERGNGTRKNERLYLGGFETYREYDGSGTGMTLEREILHVMDDKQRIALVETKTKDVSVPEGTLPETLIRYQFGNHLGSASLELDNVGQIISYEEYYPYGSTSYQAVRSQTETPKRYRYTGMERDEESGLNYHGARYYAPWLARWVSSDPLGIKDDLNSYVYVRCSPVKLLDRSGTDSRESFPPATDWNVNFPIQSPSADEPKISDLSSNDDECKGCHKAREDLPASHPFNRHPGVSPLVVNIPDENKERVNSAVSDIWNYPLFPISLPVRAVHFVTSNLVNMAVDVGLGPTKDDPVHEKLVAPVRTWGPVVLDIPATVAIGSALAPVATGMYVGEEIATQPGIYYGNRLITTESGLAHYYSTGQANLIPGAVQKVSNRWYVIHGVQEVSEGQIKRGWIIKQTMSEPDLIPSVGLDSVNLDIQLITNDPAVVNQWVKEQGAKAVKSFYDLEP